MQNLTIRHHSPDVCRGYHCVLHNPSDHHMKDWPVNWRSDRQMMERICPHGIGHPDPDDVAHHLREEPGDVYYSTHGCDGCCRPPVFTA